MMCLLKKLTMAHVLLILMFLMMILFPNFQDPDFYWHIKTGEYIFSSWSFPRYDIFTYTNYGHQWVLSEWLSQVVFYLVLDAGGLKGVAVFVAFIYVLCLYMNYSTCKRVLGEEGKAIIITLLFYIFFGGVAPRPHIFTFLFFSIVIRLLIEFKYYKNDKLIIFPVIMILWANMHGGFFIGLALMILFLFSEWVMFLWRGREGTIEYFFEKNRLVRLSCYVGAGVLVTAINPDFFRYWIYPYEAIVSSGDTNIISEWQSPNFHKAIFQYFLVMIFVFFNCIIFSDRRPDLTEVIVPSVFAMGAFIAVRNLPLATLTLSPFCAVFYKDLSFAKIFLRDGGRYDEFTSANPRLGPFSGLLGSGGRHVGSSEPAINWVILIASVVAIFIVGPRRYELMDKSMNSILPVKAVDFLIEHHIEGRMFNTYHYGGYLIYRLYPRQRVFVYGRTDIYKKGFVMEHLNIYKGGPNWRSDFEKYHVDYVLCESVAPIRQLLAVGNDFRLAYDDGVHSIMLRNEEKYKKVIDKYYQKKHI